MMPQCPGMCDDAVEVSLNWIIWECQWLSPILSLVVSLTATRNRNVERFSDLSCASLGCIIVFGPEKSATHQLGLFKVWKTLSTPCCFPSYWGRATAVCLEGAFRQREKKHLALYLASEITGFAINECSKAGKKKMFWPIETSDRIIYIIENCVQKWHLAISCLSEKISEILDS